MIRFIKEFLSPSLKCKRKGHDIKHRDAIIRKRTNTFRAVVSDYTCQLKTCQRCSKDIGEPENETFIESYTSCSMPNDMWHELNEKGYVVLSKKI